jgi:hypothetical protein
LISLSRIDQAPPQPAPEEFEAQVLKAFRLYNIVEERHLKKVLTEREVRSFVEAYLQLYLYGHNWDKVDFTISIPQSVVFTILDAVLRVPALGIVEVVVELAKLGDQGRINLAREYVYDRRNERTETEAWNGFLVRLRDYYRLSSAHRIAGIVGVNLDNIAADPQSVDARNFRAYLAFT